MVRKQKLFTWYAKIEKYIVTLHTLKKKIKGTFYLIRAQQGLAGGQTDLC